jgi:hypothetical protein
MVNAMSVELRRDSRFGGMLALALASTIPGVDVDAQSAASAASAKLNVVFPRAVEQQLALTAAPEHLRAGATVYVYGTHGFERSNDGTNGFTCLVNRDAFFYGGFAFKPTCWDKEGETSYVPVMLEVGRLLAAGESPDAVRAAVAAGFADGRFHAPSGGGVAYMLAGDVVLDPATGRVTAQIYPGHYMFYSAGVTNAQLGFSPDAAKTDPTLPYVFAAGAGGEHGLSYVIALPGDAHEHAAR